jgi:hypothetical protein
LKQLNVNALWLETGKGSIHSDMQFKADIISNANENTLSVKRLHHEIQSVIAMMEATDDEGRTRAKHAVSDVLDDYRFKQERNQAPSKSGLISNEILEIISSNQDEHVEKAIFALLESMGKLPSAQKNMWKK